MFREFHGEEEKIEEEEEDVVSAITRRIYVNRILELTYTHQDRIELFLKP